MSLRTNSSVRATDMQRFFWLLYEANDDAWPPLHARHITLLFGRIDVDALAKSFERVCTMHRALSARFSVDDGVLVQEFDAAPPRLELTDVRMHDAETRETLAASIVSDTFDRRFALTDGDPPFRMHLVLLTDEEAVLARTIHHIVSDLTSSQLFNETLWAVYRELVEGLPSTVEGSDFALFAAHEESLRSDATADKRLFWRRFLDGTRVPATRPKRSAQTLELEVADGLDKLIDADVARTGVRRSGVVLARFAHALALSGSSPEAVGYFTANRRDHRFERMVGCLAQWVPIRIEPLTDASMASIAARCNAAFEEAFANILPIGEISRAAQRPRLFDLTLSLILLPSAVEHPLPSGSRAETLAAKLAPRAQPLYSPLKIGGLDAVQLSIPMHTAGAKIAIFVRPRRLVCDFDANLISIEEVANVLSRFAERDLFAKGSAHGL